MTHPHDLNILFGLLAHQLNFVSPDQLTSALTDWVQDKEIPIGEIFVQQKVMSQEEHQLLRALVNAHVANNGGDIAKSLEQLSTADREMTQRIAQIEDLSLQNTLQYVYERKVDPERSVPSPSDKSAASRYRILRPHRRGGLGEVFIAEDRELSREVALKEIQEKHANDSDSRLRFLREAEITGRLEHPGIVPVYGLGTYDNGRPYYAMRFIRGDSLQDALEKFHSLARSQPSTSYRMGKLAVDYRNLLGRFIDVCQAIHYAHSRGILHRDLKPGNVMLGEYGETLVVDWGLAKVVSSSEVESAATTQVPIQPAFNSDSVPTMLGTAVGTPAYMSPEQAAGEINRLGPATDVYSLGATLYHILVGKPPFAGHRDIHSLIQAVKAGDFSGPRSYNVLIDRAIEAICLKAMSLEPSDRYHTPLALAKDVESYLADDVVSAYQEPWRVRVQRWARHHPAMVTGSVATLVLGLVSTVVIAALVGRHSQQISEKSAQIQKQNIEIDEKRVDAELARDAAEATTDFMVQAFRKPDPSIDGAKITVAEILLQAEEDLNNRKDLGDSQRAEMLNAVGQSFLGLGLYEDATRTLDHAVSFQIESLGITHRETLLTQNNLGVAYIYGGFPEKAISLYQQISGRMQNVLGEAHADTLSAQNNLAMAFQDYGQYDEARRLYTTTLKAQTQALGIEHPSTLTTLSNLAQTYDRETKFDQAIPMIEQVLELRKTLLGTDHPDTLTSFGNLASAYEGSGRLDRSIALLAESLEAKKAKFGRNHPDTLNSQNNLAGAYHSALQFDKALELYNDTLKRKELRLGSDHPSVARTMNNLAILYGDMGKSDLAIEMHLKLVEQMKVRYGANHPETLSSTNNLAMAYVQSERFDLAIPLLEVILAGLKASLGSEHQDVMEGQENLASAYSSTGRMDEAIRLFAASVEGLQLVLGADHPRTLNAQNNVAAALFKDKRMVEAVKLFEETLAARKVLLSPNHPDTLMSQVNLAKAYQANGQRNLALPLYDESLAAMRDMYGEDHQETMELLSEIVDAQTEANELDKATQLVRELELVIRRKLPEGTLEIASKLAQVTLQLMKVMDFNHAEEMAREVLTIRQREVPDNWTTYNAMSMLGEALLGQSKLQEAKEVLARGYEGMKQRRESIPVDTRFRLVDAIDRLIRWAEIAGDDAEKERFLCEKEETSR